MQASTGVPAQGLANARMAGPDRHPEVFDVRWPLRVADVDRTGRLKFDAATRHIQDIGSDQLREMGFEETHPLWIVRRTMIDLIEPIVFKDTLRLRRWCSGTSNRWCEMRVRIDGRRGGLMESEAFWININRETQGPARIADDFIEGLQRTTDVDRLRWKAYLKAGSREDAADITQETFLRVFARLDTLAARPDVNLSAYLFRTARNLVYDHGTRKGREVLQDDLGLLYTSDAPDQLL